MPATALGSRGRCDLHKRVRGGVDTLVPTTGVRCQWSREGGRMGQLWDLVQAYLDRHGTSERQLAKRLGYASSGVFGNWRDPKQLPSAQALARFAALSGTPYQRVLDAVLTDAGYLPEPPLTGEAIQLRRTPSAGRTRGQRSREDG